MLSAIRAAARSAKVQAAGGKALAGLAPGARLTWREAEDGLAATVVLPEGAAQDLPVRVEHALKEAGAARVLVVGTGRAEEAPKPPPPRGGHDDPLRLGTTAPRKPSAGRLEKKRPKGVRRVVAVASGKGGVGKSTVASRLALALRDRGERAGLLDLDVYGPSVPLLFGAFDHPEVTDGMMRPIERRGLSLLSIGMLVSEDQALAWRGPMVMGAVRQLMEESDWTGAEGEPLDTLVVDTPPGTGDAHLSMIQRLVIDAAILVSTPSPLALADLRRGAQLFEKMKVPVLGVVETMTGGPFGERLSEETLRTLGLASLARLPLSTSLSRLPSEGGELGQDALADLAARVASLDPPAAAR
jgi:ATP-binding protein involved in chromosome partitioning